MRILRIVLTFISIAIILSCDNDSSSKDSVTVNYNVGETLYFKGGFLREFADSTQLSYCFVIEQNPLSSMVIHDTTFIQFKITMKDYLRGNISESTDTVLISKLKYYQLQDGYVVQSLYKMQTIHADSTENPYLTRAQFPLHPVVLTEGDSHTMYRKSGEYFLSVERKFDILGMRTYNRYRGMLISGKQSLGGFNITYDFKQLFDSNGKLCSEYDFGVNIWTDEFGNKEWEVHEYQVVNRIPKPDDNDSFLKNLKVSDFVRLK